MRSFKEEELFAIILIMKDGNVLQLSGGHIRKASCRGILNPRQALLDLIDKVPILEEATVTTPEDFNWRYNDERSWWKRLIGNA